MGSINVAIIGVGNCASSLIQGIYKYSESDPDQNIPGIMNPVMGKYHIGDRGITGALESASSYFMKSPPKQFAGEDARQLAENFVAGKNQKNKNTRLDG